MIHLKISTKLALTLVLALSLNVSPRIATAQSVRLYANAIRNEMAPGVKVYHLTGEGISQDKLYLVATHTFNVYLDGRGNLVSYRVSPPVLQESQYCQTPGMLQNLCRFRTQFWTEIAARFSGAAPNANAVHQYMKDLGMDSTGMHLFRTQTTIELAFRPDLTGYWEIDGVDIFMPPGYTHWPDLILNYKREVKEEMQVAINERGIPITPAEFTNQHFDSRYVEEPTPPPPYPTVNTPPNPVQTPTPRPTPSPKSKPAPIQMEKPKPAPTPPAQRQPKPTPTPPVQPQPKPIPTPPPPAQPRTKPTPTPPVQPQPKLTPTPPPLTGTKTPWSSPPKKERPPEVPKSSQPTQPTPNLKPMPLESTSGKPIVPDPSQYKTPEQRDIYRSKYQEYLRQLEQWKQERKQLKDQ